jgi:hypothetical protein
MLVAPKTRRPRRVRNPSMGLLFTSGVLSLITENGICFHFGNGFRFGNIFLFPDRIDSSAPYRLVSETLVNRWGRTTACKSCDFIFHITNTLPPFRLSLAPRQATTKVRMTMLNLGLLFMIELSRLKLRLVSRKYWALPRNSQRKDPTL